MLSNVRRRLRAIEEKRGPLSKVRPMDMTDDELWNALDIRDPVTDALRKDISDEELRNLAQRGGPAKRSEP